MTKLDEQARWIRAREILARGDERVAERKLGLRLIRIGYKELTKFDVSDERARQLKSLSYETAGGCGREQRGMK
jgi:hypothetical protein